jgi:hypothetical protein
VVRRTADPPDGRDDADARESDGPAPAGVDSTRRRPTPTSGALAAVAAILAAGVVLAGVATVGAVAVVAEGTVAMGAAALLLGRSRPPALAAGAFLAGAGGLLLAGGVAVTAAGSPPVVGLSAALAAGGVLVLVPVLLGAPPVRLAAGVGLPGCLALAGFGLAVAATVRGNPIAAASLTSTLEALAPGVLRPAVPLAEAGVVLGLSWLWVRRAVTDGLVAPAGRVAAARPWLRRGTVALFAATLVAPALGPGLVSAARDGATHATLGGLAAVAAAGYAATVLLGAAEVPALRRPAGWLAVVVGSGGVLLGALLAPSAVGAATRALVGVVPGFVRAAGFLTDAAGSAGAVRGVVTPLVVLLALTPAFVLLAALTGAERVGLLQGERGLGAVAAGLLAAGALGSAVLTRDPARTVAAVALAVLVWDFAEFGLSLDGLVGRGETDSTADSAARAGRQSAVERGHATTSLTVAGVAIAAGVGLGSVADAASAAGPGEGAAVALLLGAAATALVALRDGD